VWGRTIHRHFGHKFIEHLNMKMLESFNLSYNTKSTVELAYKLDSITIQFLKEESLDMEFIPLSIINTDMKIDFFRERVGMSDLEIQNLVTKSNQILEYRSVRIKNGIHFFEYYGLTETQIRKSVFRTPSILTLGESNLRKKIYTIQKMLNLENLEIIHILSKYANWLSSSIYWVEHRLTFLLDLGITLKEIKICTLNHPQFLSYKIESMLKKIKVIIVSGFTNDETIKIIRRSLQVLSLDINQNLGPTLDYLLNETRIAHAYIASTPAVISLSLYKRIVPRHKRFLVAAPRGAQFKLRYLVVTKETFIKILKKATWSFYLREDQKNQPSHCYNYSPTIELSDMGSIENFLLRNSIRHLKTMW
jgi:hypothetical protein